MKTRKMYQRFKTEFWSGEWIKKHIDTMTCKRWKNRDRHKLMIVCGKCKGSGWIYWWELEENSSPANDPCDCYSDDTHYRCDECFGIGEVSAYDELS